MIRKYIIGFFAAISLACFYLIADLNYLVLFYTKDLNEVRETWKLIILIYTVAIVCLCPLLHYHMKRS